MDTASELWTQPLYSPTAVGKIVYSTFNQRILLILRALHLTHSCCVCCLKAVGRGGRDKSLV